MPFYVAHMYERNFDTKRRKREGVRQNIGKDKVREKERERER